MANLDKLISQVISHIYYNNERIIDANTLQDILVEIINQLNDKKADITYIDDELNKKVDKDYVDTELSKKVDKDYVDTELSKKVNKDYVDTEIGKKVDKDYVDTELAKKPNKDYIDTELNKKANIDSPNLTGIPTAPTPQLDNNTTQIATTEYVIKQINTILSAAQALRYKGPIGSNETLKELPNNHTVGDTYIISSPGTYAGQNCEVGDMVICRETGTTKNDKHWTIVQANINGAVIGPNTSINNNVAIFSGTTGKLIKNSGFTIEKSVPADAKFTDTVYTLPQATTTTLGGIKVGQNLTIESDGTLNANVNGQDITIDTSLSTTSTNTVQNKVITAALNKKVNAVTGKGLSTNDYTDEDKNKLDSISILENYDDTEIRGLIDDKVDKVEGKGLSTNDYTDEDKNKLDNISTLENYDDTEIRGLIDNKVDKVTGKGLSTNDYTTIEKEKLASLENYDDTTLVTSIDNKVDKVTGKGLSTNDYTTTDKNKLASLSNYDDTEIRSLINNKVNKVTGKGLSTNDYTTIEKEKLASLENYDDTTLVASIDNKVDKVEGKGLSTNDYTNTDKNKLASLKNYTLPQATTTTLGGIKIGQNLTITDDGVLNADAKDITIDTSLSTTSTNTVQNKVITVALNKKVDKVTGKGLSTNDYTTSEKQKLASLENYDDTTLVASIDNKVDKVTGKGLSTNDYTNTDKSKLASLSNYDDTKIRGLIDNKVDKVDGKGLSTNDFTNEYKNRLDNIDIDLGNLDGKYALLNGDINQDFGASYLRLKLIEKDTNINVTEGVGFYFTEDGTGSETPSVGGGGSGVSSYVDLTDKPKINNIELNGNKNANDLRIASLGSDGKILSSQLPDFILGQLMYGGDINANSVATLSSTFKNKYGITSNTLTITDAIATTYSNVYFICSANGESGIVKTLECLTGDWVISNGISWDKIRNTDAVSSVAGLVGTILASDLTNALSDEIKKIKVNTAVNADKLGGQLPSYYAKATDLSKYLPLVGGEMTGAITALVSSNFRGIRYKNDTESGGWMRPIGSVYNNENTKLGEIGAYGVGQTLNRFYIGKNYSSTDAWLTVGEDVFTYKTNPIYHSGNSNKLDVAWTSKYLQLPILTTAPVVTDGVAFYYSNTGQGSETPASGGVSSYTDITDKPNINGIELKSGNNTLAELGIAPLNHTHTIGQITSLQTTLDSKVKRVVLGTTAYNPTSGIVTLPAYPTSLPASDVSDWAKQPNKPTYTTTEVTEGTNLYFTEARAKAVKVNTAVNADKLGGQLPSYYAKATDLNKYLPLSGGEMTGAITALVSSNFRGIRYKNDTESGGWMRPIGSVYNNENTKLGEIGAYGVGQTLNRFYIGKNYSSTEAWLAVGEDVFTYKTNPIYHSGNSNKLDVAWKAKYIQLPILTTAPVVTDGVVLYYSENGTGNETLTDAGVSSYVDLTDKPKINGIALKSGNNTLYELGIASINHTHAIADITGLQTTLDSKVKQIKIGTTAYNPTSGIVTLPVYPTSLPASDVPTWAKQPNKPTYTTNEVTENTNLYFTEARAKAVKVNAAVNADKLGNQLPSYYAKATDLDKYLPLTGGEMTGTITALVSSNFRGIRYKNDNESSGWMRPIASVYNNENTKLGEIGAYGMEQNLEWFYIGTSYSAEAGWLKVGTDILRYKNYNIYHSGNSNLLTVNWSAKKLKSQTLVIPTSAPTDLVSGEIGLYWEV